MKTLLEGLALVFGFSAVAAAHAQEGPCFGINLAQVEYKEDGIDAVKPIALGARLGNRFQRNFAGEIRFGMGIADDVNVLGIPVSVSFNSFNRVRS